MAVGAVAAMGVVGITVPATAGDWDLSARASATETYSDNIRLSPSGLERHDFVTSVSPGISLHGRGGRLSVDFDYDAQAVFYGRGSNSDSINHRLQSSARAELVERIAFFNARALAGERITSNTATVAGDNLTATDNRSSFFTFSAGPELRHRIGDFADAVVTGGIDVVENEDGVDTLRNRINASLDSGNRYGRFGWELTGSRAHNDNSSDTSSTFNDVGARVRYALSRKFEPFLRLGYEDNDIHSQRDDTSGLTWRGGATWTPTPRTSVQGSYGHQFFGNSFEVSASHRMRRALFNLSYGESVTTTTTAQLDQVLVPLLDAAGEPLVDPASGVPITVATDAIDVTDEAVLDRQLRASASLTGRRTTVTLSGFDSRREFEVSGREEHIYGASAAVNRQLSRRTGVRVGANWQTSDFSSSNREDQRWSVDGSVNRNVFRDVNVSVLLRHLRNESDLASQEYDETRLSATLSVLF